MRNIFNSKNEFLQIVGPFILVIALLYITKVFLTKMDYINDPEYQNTYMKYKRDTIIYEYREKKLTD